MVFTRRSEPKAAANGVDDRRGPHAPGAQAGASAGEEAESVIGNDFTIEGQSITIRCKGSLRVNGNIQADLHSTRLTVGKEAVIHGGIAAEQVDVHGRVQGAIHGGHVVLHDTAEVEGDILSHYLSIEQGASFDGRSRRAKDPSEIRPQLESTANHGNGHSAAVAQAHPAPQVHAVPLPNVQSKILHS